MKKDKIFLDDLEKSLKDLKVKQSNIDTIIKKYQDIIIEEKNNKKKIKYIIKELGEPKDIALKEKELLKSNNIKKDKSNNYFFTKIKSIFKMVLLFFSNLLKNIGHFFKGFYHFISKDITLNSIKEERNNRKKIKEEKAKIKEAKTENEEEKIVVIESKKDVEEDNKNIDDVIDNSESKIIVKRFKLKLIFFILFFLLFIISSVITVASLFSILDGIRLFGLSLGLISFSVLLFFITIVFYISLFGKKINYIVFFIILIILILGTVFGICDFLHEIYNLEYVDDVSIKYSMTNKLDIYDIPDNKKMYLIFNSNYNTQYVVNYDKNLNNKVKVSVQYYECYYDYYIKKSSNSIYVSLKLDPKDRFSTYIDDMKEKKVFNNDELSRYVVTITINEDDYSRLVIQN